MGVYRHVDRLPGKCRLRGPATGGQPRRQLHRSLACCPIAASNSMHALSCPTTLLASPLHPCHLPHRPQVVLISLMCSNTLRRKHPWNLLALLAFTLVESVLVGVICSYWDVGVVLEAFGATAAAVGGLTLVAVFGKFDMTKVGKESVWVYGCVVVGGECWLACSRVSGGQFREGMPLEASIIWLTVLCSLPDCDPLPPHPHHPHPHLPACAPPCSAATCCPWPPACSSCSSS